MSLSSELCDVVVMNAELFALQCEAEGMKAENKWRENLGHGIAYGDEAFNDLKKRTLELIEKWKA